MTSDEIVERLCANFVQQIEAEFQNRFMRAMGPEIRFLVDVLAYGFLRAHVDALTAFEDGDVDAARRLRAAAWRMAGPHTPDPVPPRG